MIAAINAASAPVRSVDLPSGRDADRTSGAPSEVCRSSAAITFTAPKPAHMFASLTRGAIEVAAIGTPEAAIVSTQNLYAVTPQEVSALFAARALDSNKGRFGHVLVVGGSHGKSGAAAMCGMAALRVGAGLATVAAPVSVMPTIAGFAAELMTEGLGEDGSRYASAWGCGALPGTGEIPRRACYWSGHFAASGGGGVRASYGEGRALPGGAGRRWAERVRRIAGTPARRKLPAHPHPSSGRDGEADGTERSRGPSRPGWRGADLCAAASLHPGAEGIPHGDRLSRWRRRGRRPWEIPEWRPEAPATS